MITFTKLINKEIFDKDFRSFEKNNTLSFTTSGKMVVLYGPNGVGKTSLVKAFQVGKETSTAFGYQGITFITSGQSIT